jgi:multicomponent Na+:H+ antiporter subunit E
MIRRVAALFAWAFGVWLLLTWTVATAQLVFGAILAGLVAAALAPLGEVAPPWRLLGPRVLVAALRLTAVALARIVRANAELAVRIWRPSRPLRSGMIVLPTPMRTDVGLGGLGLITSLIVDNQIVDLDRNRHELQFHAIAVPDGDGAARREAISAPIERLLAPLVGDPPGTGPKGE